jgi:CTP:molybdopterin cytidylyltransferase MocA
LAGQVTAFVFVGGWGASEPEQALRQAHQAAADDLILALLDTGLVERVIVATDGPWAGASGDLPVKIDQDTRGASFHFGERLAGLIERHESERVLYAGGGSAPLLRAERWQAILGRLAQADGLVLANNLHSCDWAGFTAAAEVAARVARVGNDNGLAWSLAEDTPLAAEDLAPSAATRFDLDTPSDLLVARYHGGVGPKLRRFLETLEWDGTNVRRVAMAMAEEGGSLAIVGRTSSAAWAAVERSTRCWVRIFAEERGMRASGRQERGEVNSLLSDYLSLVGPEAFFGRLGELVKGLVMDSRVVLAARGAWPCTSDRFYSDLLRWQEVADPFLRQFTSAACRATVPVLLGGQALVAGGLMALAEASGPESAATQ